MSKYCPKCGFENENEAQFCSKCGTNIDKGISQKAMYGQDGTPPDDVKSWNMGAFMMTAVWGIANEVYEALWVFAAVIPIIGWIAAIAVMIWMGISGNELAYRKKHYDTVSDFKQAQNTWNRAGWFTFIISIITGFIYLIAFVILGIAESAY